ncbi:hypothetical protein DMR09_23860 [Klebsiella variicola]|uniref:hypothetical protein n=1 Tax=Klebsiella variicola TaxID=244366 RepID=UPI000D744B42|nr:hypothetical protein [Klebsiella variicola]PXK09675.1 hypothetical protein DMR09_23860 [Klebsiella variicola]
MRTFHLLDRNIVDLMELSNRNSNIPDDKRQKKIAELKSNDLVGNIFSPLLSILEGKIKRDKDTNGRIVAIPPSLAEIKNQIVNEATTVKNFIKNSRTDYDFLLANLDYLSQLLFNKEDDKLIDIKIEYLNKLKEAVGNIVPVNQRESQYKKFKAISNEYKLLKEQPITLFVLMYIFGSNQSANFLKFKRPSFIAYNPISDINHIKDTIKLIHSIDLTQDVSIVFESLDSDIEFISSIINYTSSSSSPNPEDRTVKIITNWTPNLQKMAEEIPETKGIDNKELFFDCYKDFYEYDPRDYL